MTYAIDFVGIRKGKPDPVVLREEFTREVAVRVRYLELAKQATEDQQLEAFRLCMNDAGSNPWSKPFLYLDSIKKA